MALHSNGILWKLVIRSSAVGLLGQEGTWQWEERSCHSAHLLLSDRAEYYNDFSRGAGNTDFSKKMHTKRKCHLSGYGIWATAFDLHEMLPKLLVSIP